MKIRCIKNPHQCTMSPAAPLEFSLKKKRRRSIRKADLNTSSILWNINDCNAYNNTFSRYIGRSEPKQSLHDTEMMARSNKMEQDFNTPYFYEAGPTVKRTRSTTSPPRWLEYTNNVWNDTKRSSRHTTWYIFYRSLYTWYFTRWTKSHTTAISARHHT